MSGLWAGTWGIVSATLALWRSRYVLYVMRNGVILHPPSWLVAARGAYLGAMWGAASGALFSVLLMAIARKRRDLSSLSAIQTGACGATAVALPWLAHLYLRGHNAGLARAFVIPVLGLWPTIIGGGALAASAILLARRSHATTLVSRSLNR
ncbi:MAG: hypothetical protein ACJ796_04755 [Gemmatimonadaceae bacterium]